MRLSRSLAVAVFALALVAPVASAQSPATTGYDETGVLPQIPQKGDVIPPPPGGTLGANTDDGVREATPGTPADTPVTERRETGAPPVKAGTLPFTGLDVGIVALLGLLLVGTGFALRRTRPARAS